MGELYAWIREVPGTVPVLFLHGVYFDHHLWDWHTERITDHTTIAIDMPLHGKSGGQAKNGWTLADCSKMVIEILDALNIREVIAIGHSWGSMSILRAAHDNPDRFTAVGLCNMPFKAASIRTRILFKMQHLLLGFRTFYTKQVAKALFGRDTFQADPGLLALLESSMSRLSGTEIRETDTAVIIHAENTEPLIRSLEVPALALRGKEDYVPESAYIRTTTVLGGHVSPAEAPEDVFSFIRAVIERQGGI